jgi:GH24 family phage-related lysozyme (muramidase)
VEARFRASAIKEEGYRNTVYLDNLGKPTVGIGHLVKFSDGLKVGDIITDARVEELFQQDSMKAIDAAFSQARAMGKEGNLEFVEALAHVNFQLGTNWNSKFYETYPLLLEGNWQQAIQNLRVSLWASQTPRRVANFTAAIERAFA